MRGAPLRFGQWLLIVALLSATGAQWLALQSIAWGAMLVDYSRDSSLSAAMVKTFDGAHPCGLCQSIEHGKKAERKSAAVVIAKIDLFHQPSARLIVKAVPISQLVVTSSHAERRVEPPPQPPPRGRLG